jgi:hypothetical protein
LGECKNLNLSDCGKITDESVKFLTKCEKLNLSYCQNVTNESVKLLGGCRELNLSHCKNITNESVKFLGKCEKLNILGCPAYEDLNLIEKYLNCNLQKKIFDLCVNENDNEYENNNYGLNIWLEATERHLTAYNTQLKQVDIIQQLIIKNDNCQKLKEKRERTFQERKQSSMKKFQIKQTNRNNITKSFRKFH